MQKNYKKNCIYQYIYSYECQGLYIIKNQNFVSIHTLRYLINVHARLFIFWIFSSLHALIWSCTFINFWKIFTACTLIWSCTFGFFCYFHLNCLLKCLFDPAHFFIFSQNSSLHVYLILHVYLFLAKIPACTFNWDCTFIWYLRVSTNVVLTMRASTLSNHYI